MWYSLAVVLVRCSAANVQCLGRDASLCPGTLVVSLPGMGRIRVRNKLRIETWNSPPQCSGTGARAARLMQCRDNLDGDLGLSTLNRALTGRGRVRLESQDFRGIRARCCCKLWSWMVP